VPIIPRCSTAGTGVDRRRISGFLPAGLKRRRSVADRERARLSKAVQVDYSLTSTAARLVQRVGSPLMIPSVSGSPVTSRNGKAIARSDFACWLARQDAIYDIDLTTEHVGAARDMNPSLATRLVI